MNIEAHSPMIWPEEFRCHDAPFGFGSRTGDPFGLFRVPGSAANGRELRIIATDGAISDDPQRWEHVSVSIPDSEKAPSWQEMCIVKDLFWPKDACVVQFHPPEADYVNNHPGCLHLWRCVGIEFPMPPKEFV